jgi:hypothetical protein
MSALISDDQLHAIKDRNSVADYAGKFVALRSKRGRSVGQFVGPCPICSDDPQSRDAMRFECDAEKWVCAVCADGGDIIKLVIKREGLTFPEAIERLGGTREEVVTPAVAERRGAQAFKLDATAAHPCRPAASPFADGELSAAYHRGYDRAQKAHAAGLIYRERERKRLYKFWQDASRLPGSPAAAYLARRRLLVPADARLRCHLSMPYFGDGREHEPRLLHRGPAMLAPIMIAGVFAGLHITWLDPAGPKGKASIVDPESGEVLPSKKVRGSKAGGYIDLGGHGDPGVRTVRRMFAGEGIETVLAVYTALQNAKRSRDGDAFRSGVDIGNLCGRAVETVPHPTEKTAAGRVKRIPGPVADMTAPAMPVPDDCPELVLLGDGDSEPFFTRTALQRATQRHERPGRLVRVAIAPAGCDFNDLL